MGLLMLTGIIRLYNAVRWGYFYVYKWQLLKWGHNDTMGNQQSYIYTHIYIIYVYMGVVFFGTVVIIYAAYHGKLKKSW